MDPLATAAPLARLLLAMSETGREGELSLSQRTRTAKLSIGRGRVLALSGVDVRPLGDRLLALGALDLGSTHGLLAHPPASRVGAWLVAAGATSPAAVVRALELQLTEGLEALLRWPTRDLTFSHGPVRSSSGGAQLDLSSAVWSALFALAATLPEAQLRQLAGQGELSLTPAGTRRVRGLLHARESGALALSQARRALVFGASSAGPVELPRTEAQLARTLGARPDVSDLPVRAVLRVLGSALARPHAEDAYTLLLRKTRELSRNASACVLLDLPTSASSAHARRALRRLARKLHPDRFHASDARLHAVSHRVMGALAQAEQALRGAASA